MGRNVKKRGGGEGKRDSPSHMMGGGGLYNL